MRDHQFDAITTGATWRGTRRRVAQGLLVAGVAAVVALRRARQAHADPCHRLCAQQCAGKGRQHRFCMDLCVNATAC